jgi:hypothetical protein
MKPSYKYTPRRTDRNQSEIVNVFRKLGCMVDCLHAAGGGCFDLVLQVAWLNIRVEVKDYMKPASKRQFTPMQKRWNFSATGLRCVITTIHEAKCLVEAARDFVESVRLYVPKAKMDAIKGNQELIYQPSLH